MEDVVLWLRNVTKEYGTGRARVLAVDDVSLEVRQGEIVLVMGPSGSGKTTLLSMMGCILRPTDGNIWLRGTEVSALPEGALAHVRRRHIGFVFQSFNLLSSLSVWENVALALQIGGTRGEAGARQAKELLEAVGLGDRLDSLPADLSGGEKQRVSIARALANSPSLLIGDEPTANLDSENGRRVADMLTTLARDQGRSVVIATHDARIMDVADRVLYLVDGRLAKKPRVHQG
ncbi:MAG: ABC transporter ATP-binding protein [Chloroflexi bacterium]|nr:ABC transporter ATP-binding protein [Chloroflexota bacterium]